jgi:hypothetical protein
MTTVDHTPPTTPRPVEMRQPCKYGCGTTDGYATLKGFQDVVRCGACGRAQYNMPRTESGMRPISLKERIGLDVTTRFQIIRMWDHRCAFCGTDDFQKNGELQLAHLISRKDADKYGLLDELIDDPVNLVPSCAACNLGDRMGPMQIRLLARLLMIQHRRQRETDEEAA